MGGYIQGRVLVSAILGVVITLGLRILGLSEFALALGVIAGFTNLIPFVGPVLGAVPALIVAIPQSGLTFLWVLLLFVLIQNLETYVLDPLLVGSSVRVRPLYQLLAVLGGTQVLGIIGAVIVPPWVAGVGVLVENLYLQPKLLNEEKSAIYKLPLNSDNQPTSDSGNISDGVSQSVEK
jgi:predicted PurR-regulated permease PerM